MSDLLNFGFINPSFAAANPYRQLFGLRALRYMQPRAARVPRPGRQMNPFFGGQEDPNAGFAQLSQTPEGREAADQYLGQYGQQALSPEQASPFALLPNRGVFAAHPRLFSGLEGALYAMGSMPQPGETTGGNIMGAAQGVLAGLGARQRALNQQYAAPFEAAHSLEGMRAMGLKNEMDYATLHYRQAQIRQMNDKGDQALLRAEATRPVPVEGGTQQFNPGTGKWEFVPGPTTKSNTQPPFNVKYDQYTGDALAAMGIHDPSQATPEQWQQAIQKAQARHNAERSAGRPPSDSMSKIQAQVYRDLVSGDPQRMQRGMQGLGVLGQMNSAEKGPGQNAALVNRLFTNQKFRNEMRIEMSQQPQYRGRKITDIKDSEIKDYIQQRFGGEEGGGSPMNFNVPQSFTPPAGARVRDYTQLNPR